MMGLDNLASIGESIMIFNNSALLNLAGIEDVTFVGNCIWINSNEALISLEGLENVTSIEGFLDIIINHSLTSLAGLEGLTYIGRFLRIAENNALVNLEGLNNLAFIGWYMVIGERDEYGYCHGNDALLNLEGLESITSAKGLVLEYNHNLISLTGVDDIEADSLMNISINNNYSLSTCEVQSICDYLASPNGTTLIYSNQTGCNSPQEVETACELISIAEFNLADHFSVFPNPTDDIAHFSFRNVNG